MNTAIEYPSTHTNRAYLLATGIWGSRTRASLPYSVRWDYLESKLDIIQFLPRVDQAFLCSR